MSTVKRFIKYFFRPKKDSDSILTFFVYGLLLISLVYITSASINTSTTVGSTFRNIVKQVFIVVSSLMLFNFFSNFFDGKRCRKNIIIYLVLELLLLITAYVYCKLTGDINGNYSWITINLGLFQFGIQPSEFAKTFIVLSNACLLGDRKFKNIDSQWQMIKFPLFFLLAYFGIIIFLQKDAGSGLIVWMIGCICFLFTSNKKLRGLRLLLVFLAFLAIGAYFYCLLTESGRAILEKVSTTFSARFSAVTDPSYNNDATREIFYSLLGISNGNIFGVGLGNSVQKFGYLVSSDADYIFAVIVEECGILGILSIFVPYIFIISRLLYYSKRVTKEFDKIILLGTVVYLSIHFFFNVGGVSGLVPLTGVPLLLVSRGGSATFSIMVLLGICQNRIANYYAEKKAKSGFID